MADYTVRFELWVTADSPEEAARYALDDLQDRSLGPWTAEVTDLDGPGGAPQHVTVGGGPGAKS